MNGIEMRISDLTESKIEMIKNCLKSDPDARWFKISREALESLISTDHDR